MLRVKIFITSTMTPKEYREKMLRVTPLMKWLLKSLLTSLDFLFFFFFKGVTGQVYTLSHLSSSSQTKGTNSPYKIHQHTNCVLFHPRRYKILNFQPSFINKISCTLYRLSLNIFNNKLTNHSPMLFTTYMM